MANRAVKVQNQFCVRVVYVIQKLCIKDDDGWLWQDIKKRHCIKTKGKGQYWGLSTWVIECYSRGFEMRRRQEVAETDMNFSSCQRNDCNDSGADSTGDNGRRVGSNTAVVLITVICTIGIVFWPGFFISQ